MISKIRFLACLRELFFMPIFQLGISATVGGLVLADWFCTEVLRLSGTGRIIAWVLPFGSSMLLCVVACYKQFSGVTELPTDATAPLNRLVRNIVVLIPLLVGVALVINPLVSRDYGKSAEHMEISLK